MPILGATADGAVLRVKVVPGASRDRIVGPLDDRLKVAVRKPPEKGAANRAVCRLVARAACVRPADVEVLSGPARPEKELLVRGVTASALARALGIEDALG